MVAIRGKKTKATAKLKAAATPKIKASATKNADTASVKRLTPQQTLTRHHEEEFLTLVRFALQSTLVLTGSTGDSPVSTICNALVTALSANGKDKTLTPTQILTRLPRSERKRVCGAIFSADEIAYSCRNCQLDTTCVMCKDCFTHSDHAGHDVYFQRTTAGSSCDCGDGHAWKQCGFCSRHQGTEGMETGRQKGKLPKQIGVVAPVVIDAVVEHLYRVLLGIEYGFELAEAFELFTRDIPPNLLPIQSDTDVADATESRKGCGVGKNSRVIGSTRSARLSAQFTAETGSKSVGPGGRLEAQTSEGKRETTKVDNGLSDGVLFGIRLHNDDVHSLNEVINHLYVELGMSKPQARTVVSQVDDQGDATISTKSLLLCPGIVGNLVRRSLNISVAPAWWEKQMEGVPALLEWLQYVSTTSDGLRELVSEALQKQRSPALRGFASMSSCLPKGKTVREFIKERHIRLHNHALDALVTLTSGDKDVFTWAWQQETAQQQRFDFCAEDSAVSVVSTGFLAEGNCVSCKNIFIDEFVKAVSLSSSYRQHESVRKSFDLVVTKYITSEQANSSDISSTTSSALTLLIRYDCTLRKNAVERSHSFLREHLVDVQFRASMLEAYLRSYSSMTNMFLRGLGNSSESVFDFAVQFLTVPHLVQNYTTKEVAAHPGRVELVHELLCALNTVFESAIDKKDGLLNADHPALSSQKYKYCVENMEYVFNVGTLSSELVCIADNLKIWLSCLNILQGGDPQVRRGIHQNHVEYESDSWLSMFNLGIRVHSVFAISWNGFNLSQFEAPEVKVAEIFGPIIEATLSSSTHFNEKVAKKTLVSVAKLTSMSKSGAGGREKNIMTYDFNVASQPTSLHIPLHRFLTAAVRHICVSPSGLGNSIPSDGLLRFFGFDQLAVDKQWELVEMPLRCLVMASQIQSNLWRRNGDENMLAQLYNYSALPYCIHYRDADTLMLQLGVLMAGPNAMLARIVDRFQLGSYFVLPNGTLFAASNEYSLAGPDELAKQFGYSGVEQGVDEQQSLQMLEEFLRLVITLGTSLPSSTGITYDNEFLAEEMLQQLCAKPVPFSKLVDVAILPSGQDDIPTLRMEGILATVSNFVPPSGLEPGRYELKEGLLESYNPYFLHLNREAHELARDRWTNYRNACRQKAKTATPDSPPKEPLKAAKPPVDFFRPVQTILTCESTVAIIQIILWKVVSSVQTGSASAASEKSVSDAVISTCLHLLVHGVHTAATGSDRRFWSRLSKASTATSKLSVLNLLSQLLEQATTLLDCEQTGTVEWLVWKITTESPVCRKVFEQAANDTKAKQKKAETSPLVSCGSAQDVYSPPKTLEQRKLEARKRVMDAMTKRQAAFQAMVDVSDEKGREKMDNLKEGMSDDDARASLGKREASMVDEPEEKRQKVGNKRCYNCILCHDSSAQGQMGMAAYVHQSTVLAPGFRPEPNEALSLEGMKVRSHVKSVIEKMELCSGGSSTPSDMANSSPTLRAFATTFPEWSMDGSLDDQLTRNNTTQNSPRPSAARRPRNDRIRFGNGNIPMLEGELLQTDEELEVLEGVLDLREDQMLFPVDMRGAINLDLHGDRTEPRRLGVLEVARARGGNARGQGGLMYDSDEEDVSSRFRLEHMPPGFGRSHQSSKLYLTPCGLHIRTCHHAVHIQCLERYITSLHDKAIRGEEFDGVQAIDPDSAMTQFLCPLCKTLSNLLIPTSESGLSIAEGDEYKCVVRASIGDEKEKSLTWDSIVEEQLSMPGWYRSVLGRDGGLKDGDSYTEHDLWRDYFEETLWEPHGSLEKGAPFLWSACAFTLASFLTVVEDESNSGSRFDPLTDHCPPSLEKELESLIAVTKFCRWTFSLLEHCADAKVIWETAKRCCPINSETKREYRKFTKVLGSIDACLRGTILGLLVADTFTAFVVASVIADRLETIWRFIPVFVAADLLQRLHAEFFELSKVEGSPLFQDKFSAVAMSASEIKNPAYPVPASESVLAPRCTRSGRAISPAPVPRTNTGSVQQLMEAMEASGESDSEAYAALLLLQRMTKAFPSEKLRPLSTTSDVNARLKRILPLNATFVRRMMLFWRCLVGEGISAPTSTRTMQIPTLVDIACSTDATFDQIWRWCMDRMLSKTHLGSSKIGDKCEHSEGCSEAYVASMFILREVPTRPRLIELPIQYDELYSEMAGRKCTRCEKAPCDPGLCLICGEFLCCGDSCCTRAFMPHGPPVGECTRHAAECGGGVGIVLLLEQCRIAVVGGSMAAYFPCPYVDSHGEEDVGLQRGRPLRLDMVRYRYLESLWLNHRIFTEVSRQRNQRDPQYTINLSYL